MDYGKQMEIEGRFNEIHKELCNLCRLHLEKTNAREQDKYNLQCLVSVSKLAKDYRYHLSPLILKDNEVAISFLINVFSEIINQDNWDEKNLNLLSDKLNEMLDRKIVNTVDERKEK